MEVAPIDIRKELMLLDITGIIGINESAMVISVTKESSILIFGHVGVILLIRVGAQPVFSPCHKTSYQIDCVSRNLLVYSTVIPRW